MNLVRLSWHCAKKGIQVGSVLGCILAPIVFFKSKKSSIKTLVRLQTYTMLTGVAISQAMMMSKYNNW